MNRVDFNGVKVFPFTSADNLIDYIDEHKGILVAINAEKILHANKQMIDLINSNVGYCDGSGALIAMKQRGFKDVCKIPGCELWLKIVNRFYNNKSFYLVGSSQSVIEEAIAKLKTDFSGISILGYRDGYFNNEEEEDILINDIVSKRPDIIFVAMGSPHQEIFMQKIQKRYNAIFQGLGGSFDVYTGHVCRAPQWWLDHNLEFAYRLIKEPRRIKRQIHLVKFAWLLLLKKI